MSLSPDWTDASLYRGVRNDIRDIAEAAPRTCAHAGDGRTASAARTLYSGYREAAGFEEICMEQCRCTLTSRAANSDHNLPNCELRNTNWPPIPTRSPTLYLRHLFKFLASALASSATILDSWRYGFLKGVFQVSLAAFRVDAGRRPCARNRCSRAPCRGRRSHARGDASRRGQTRCTTIRGHRWLKPRNPLRTPRDPS